MLDPECSPFKIWEHVAVLNGIAELDSFHAVGRSDLARSDGTIKALDDRRMSSQEESNTPGMTGKYTEHC